MTAGPGSSAERRVRIGIVRFINSYPFARILLAEGPRLGLECRLLEPAAIADGLARGELDAGLVPSIELGRQPGLRVLPVAPIAARHEVRSVLLLSRVPVDRIRRVAVDSASRTSVVLLELLLEDRYGCRVQLFPSEDPLEQLRAGVDAALVIGDRALGVSRAECLKLDLAGEWLEWTGLPFVFAVWAVERNVWDRFPRERFSACLERAIEDLPAAARELAVERGQPESAILDYLSRNLCYRWSPEVARGLEEFLDRARRRGKLPALAALDSAVAADSP